MNPKKLSDLGLDLLNLLLADVQTGVGPFLAVYLATHGWDEQLVGIALTVGGLSGIAMQVPAGYLIDQLDFRRGIMAVSTLAVAFGALIVAFLPSFWPIIAAQVVIGGMAAFFVPAIAALSIGLVGRRGFAKRQGRNQTYNGIGNVAAATAIGWIGYYYSNRDIFFFVAAMAFPAALSLLLIQPKQINSRAARGYDSDKDQAAGIWKLLRRRPLMIFLLCAVMYHFANAAMMPLLGQMLSKGKGRESMPFMSACVMTTQLTVSLIAWWVGRYATDHGRKPLLLVAFAVLPLRGVLYTLTHNSTLLIAIQLLDGISAGIFGVISVLVIADLTHGTGRFNLALGVITASAGMGAALSQLAAGAVVKEFGYNTGFLFLAAVASVGALVMGLAMPETAKD